MEKEMNRNVCGVFGQTVNFKCRLRLEVIFQIYM